MPSIRFVSSATQIPDQLWATCFAPPVEGRWWYEALEGCGIDDQFTFLYAVIGEDDRAVGIAPAFVMNVPVELVLPAGLVPLFRFLGKAFPSVLRQRTLFVGSPCSDEGAVGLLPGIDRKGAFSALQAAFEGRARALGCSMLIWKDFPEADKQDLIWLAERHRLFPMASFPGTIVHLPSNDKEAYFASMKGSRRHILRKKLRRSAQAVDVATEIVQNPAASVLDEIFGLFWQTYEKAETKFERLNRRFFDLLAEQSVCRFVILRERASGQMIAFMLCFVLGRRLINKFIGIDYGRPKSWLLYFRLWEAALDWALSLGASSIQSGQTGYAPKIELGHDLLPLTNYCRHGNILVHYLYALIARRIGWHTLDVDLARHLKAHPEAAPQAYSRKPRSRVNAAR
jgi:hypothetical protein